jgi:hypothetical protein
LIQKLLGLSINLSPKVEVRKYEPVVRKEDKYSKKTFILPEDLINGYGYENNICLDRRDQINSKDMVLLPF